MKSGELRISGGLMKVAQAMAASSVFSLVHINPWITTGLCLMLPVCIFFCQLDNPVSHFHFFKSIEHMQTSDSEEQS